MRPPPRRPPIRKSKRYFTIDNAIKGVIACLVLGIVYNYFSTDLQKDTKEASTQDLIADTTPTLAFDFGNEWIKVCIEDPKSKDHLQLALNEQAQRKTASLVGFSKKQPVSRLFGDAASRLLRQDPSAVFRDLKSVLGQKMDSSIVQRFQKEHQQYQLTSTPRDTVQFTTANGSLTVEDVTAMLFQHAQRFANEQAGSDVVDTVLTVPSYFREDQVQLLNQVAQLAGLHVVNTITELEAGMLSLGNTHCKTVAIDYSLRGHLDVKHKIILFDIGTLTSTASLVEIFYDRGILIKTLASETQHVGGRDLDWLVADYLEKQLNVAAKDSTGKTWDNLLMEAKKAKEFLSASTFADVEISQKQTRITREVFEELASQLFNDMVQPLKKILVLTSASEIKTIELYGGGTRIPALQTLIEKETNIPIGKHINADEGASLGACHYAAVLKKARFARRVALINNLPKKASASPSVVLSADEMEDSKQKLLKWKVQEQIRKLVLQNRSDLESYVLDAKYKLDDISNAQDSHQLKTILEETNAWLEVTNQEHLWKEYSQKLTDVKSQVEPILARNKQKEL